MKVDRQRIKLAMARACVNSAELAEITELPRPTLNNAIAGRSVRPATAGRIAKALGVDVTEILEKEE